eukprot:4753577-Pyramimonas_sp.AAC.1
MLDGETPPKSAAFAAQIELLAAVRAKEKSDKGSATGLHGYKPVAQRAGTLGGEDARRAALQQLAQRKQETAGQWGEAAQTELAQALMSDDWNFDMRSALGNKFYRARKENSDYGRKLNLEWQGCINKAAFKRQWMEETLPNEIKEFRRTVEEHSQEWIETGELMGFMRM